MSVPQLLKWIGNKRKYSEEIVSLMPQEINTYIEPFLGSGAVMGELLRQKDLIGGIQINNVIGSDVLEPLIGIFQLLKEEPQALIDYYTNTIGRFNSDRDNVYLEVRERFNETRNPLDFLILSRTCYSGIIRFRKKDGYMSTPIGPHKPIGNEEFEERVKLWSNLIRNVNFINCDYRQAMQMAGEGDLIYCDPPYTHSQSILYGAQAFNINELWDSIQQAKDRGAKVMLSINGKKKNKQEDISTPIPEGLFERYVYIDCGISMINRLQKTGEIMKDEEVHDLLLLTW